MNIVKKSIKCNLSINNNSIATIEQLHENITIELVDLFHSGQLLKWFESRDNNILQKLNTINKHQDTRSLFIEILNAIGVQLDQQEIDSLLTKHDMVTDNKLDKSQVGKSMLSENNITKNNHEIALDNRANSPVENKGNILAKIEAELDRLNIDEETKNNCIKNIAVKLQQEKLNMLIVGATGSGKSTTINALFNLDVATVGKGTDPETMDIQKYNLHNNLVLWDTPGLGDSTEKDKQHIAKIVSILQEEDSDGNALIDLVLVIIDGSSRDMGTSYSLINDTIIPNMKEKDRIIIAINQCDIAMKGKGWNLSENKPTPELEKFLQNKSESVNKRIYDSTHIEVESMYYSAEYKYNINRLLYFILKSTPENKRTVYINNINNQKENWTHDDGQINYDQENQNILGGSFTKAAMGASAGAAIGSVIPVIGTAVGAVIGGIFGFFFS